MKGSKDDMHMVLDALFGEGGGRRQMKGPYLPVKKEDISDALALVEVKNFTPGQAVMVISETISPYKTPGAGNICIVLEHLAPSTEALIDDGGRAFLHNNFTSMRVICFKARDDGGPDGARILSVCPRYFKAVDESTLSNRQLTDLKSLQEIYTQFGVVEKFEPGDYVKWKPCLANRAVPQQHDVAMFIGYVDGKYRDNAGSILHGELRDCVIACKDSDGGIREYMFDSRMFTKA